LTDARDPIQADPQGEGTTAMNTGWKRSPVACALAALLSSIGGCSLIKSPVVAPAGPVALAERDLMVWAFALMMIVAIPVFVLTLWFARTYRAGNPDARRLPDWRGSRWVEAVIWLVPAAIVVMLGVFIWNDTHRLDPYRPVASQSRALRVQVIAQNWKWVFIYPDQGVATVNELAIPVNVPVKLEITSDTVMNALYIPRLAGQVYAMAGMRTKLNLLASKIGTFVGRNSQYSGKGFSEQHFVVRAMSHVDFAKWVDGVKRSNEVLDNETYARLTRHWSTSPVVHYSRVTPGLFAKVIEDYWRGASSKAAGTRPATVRPAS
jgi:cytochrome o ubiquinol oxidase subunit II